MGEKIENMWNDFSVNDRWIFISRLGFHYKISSVDGRLFEELPQLFQKHILHTSEVVGV